MVNYESAVNLLKTARNVHHWNELREVVKATVPMKDLIKIDGSGLIVKVLGPDKYTQYNQ